jgi:hypothetical protein
MLLQKVPVKRWSLRKWYGELVEELLYPLNFGFRL